MFTSPTSQPAAAEGSTTSSVEAAEQPVTQDGGGGKWVEHAVPIDSSGIETQTGERSEQKIWTIEDMGDRLLAVGTYGGGFAAWESTDFRSFTPVYSEVCCGRSVSSPHASAFGERWLIGGSERIVRNGGEVERSFVSVSDDHGRSWTIVDDPLFTERATRIDGFLVAGDVVIVEAVEEPANGGPISIPAWSTDLVTWTPIELPGDARVEGISLFGDGTSVWAVGSALRPDGDYDLELWTSTDSGRSFELISSLMSNSWSMTRVGDRLVTWPYVRQDVYRDEQAQAPTLTTASGTLTELAVDTGQWGDGDVRFGPSAIVPSDGRLYGVVGRLRYASVQYCYADPSGCWQWETALATSIDGVEWFDVAASNFESTFGNSGGMSARPDGSILIWASPDRSPTVEVIEWTGPGTPLLVDPEEYPPPDRSVPLFDQDIQLEVGDTVRYPLGLGGCSGLYTGAKSWEPEQPLPDPIPSDWPSRTVEIADGPSAYLFGTVTLVADDTIEFGIDGVGTVATFHPRTEEPQYFCA
jgi:hypothetical protein